MEGVKHGKILEIEYLKWKCLMLVIKMTNHVMLKAHITELPVNCKME